MELFWKTASAMMLILLTASVLALAFNIQTVKAIGTIYIRADGSVDPPTANITTTDNVTYTFTDNNYDSIVVERNNTVIDGDGYMLQGTGASGSRGIDLSGRTNVTVRNTQIESFEDGILLDSSSDNSIAGNNIANSFFGILLRYSSNYNSLIANSLADNNYSIYFYLASSNSVSGNNITDSSVGIWLLISSNNSVSGNNIARNSYGIHFGYGTGSVDNIFSHNNFAFNNQQVNSYILNANAWDAGYPFRGNYWSDYNGTDLFKGVNQNETGSDGIGDVPYIIDGNNTDRYPLMDMFPSSDVFWIDLMIEKYNELSSLYQSLNSTYNELNSIYNDLKSRQQATLSELNYNRNLTYLFISTTIIFVTTTIYLAARKTRPKPETKTP